MVRCTRFDAADYLDNEETIAAYPTAALEDDNADLFLTAVNDVARARGMTQLARDSGPGRESLYKSLAPGAKPRYDTVLKVVRALGVTLRAEASHGRARCVSKGAAPAPAAQHRSPAPAGPRSARRGRRTS